MGVSLYMLDLGCVESHENLVYEFNCGVIFPLVCIFVIVVTMVKLMDKLELGICETYDVECGILPH